MNHVEVVYEAGFCLPRLIVKQEMQEDCVEKVWELGQEYKLELYRVFFLTGPTLKITSMEKS